MFWVKFHKGALDREKPPSWQHLLPRGHTHLSFPTLPSPSCVFLPLNLWWSCWTPRWPSCHGRKKSGKFSVPLVSWISKQKKQRVKQRARNHEAQSRKGEKSRRFPPFPRPWVVKCTQYITKARCKGFHSGWNLGPAGKAPIDQARISFQVLSLIYVPWYWWTDLWNMVVQYLIDTLNPTWENVLKTTLRSCLPK